MQRLYNKPEKLRGLPLCLQSLRSAGMMTAAASRSVAATTCLG